MPVRRRRNAPPRSLSRLAWFAAIVAVVALVGLVSPGSPGAIPVVTGQQNQPPTVSGSASPSVAENTTTVGTYTATDPEGDTVTWSLNNNTDFEITSGGVLSFKVAPDFEGTTSYTVVVIASDGNSTGELSVTITVTGVDEPPVVSGLATVEIDEGETDVASYSAEDPEGATVSLVALSGDDAAKFKIDSDGDLSFKSAPDFENPTDVATPPDQPDNVYEVTVGYSDGSLTGTLDVEVTVTDVNETPTLKGLASITVPENTTTVLETYTATDPEGTPSRGGGGDGRAVLLDQQRRAQLQRPSKLRGEEDLCAHGHGAGHGCERRVDRRDGHAYRCRRGPRSLPSRWRRRVRERGVNGEGHLHVHRRTGGR